MTDDFDKLYDERFPSNEAKRLRDREQRAMKLLVELEQHPSTLWLRPMDLGARDASYHSATLKRLADQGLVERQLRGTLMNEIGGGRGSYVYKATKLGRQMAKKWLATHSRYEE